MPQQIGHIVNSFHLGRRVEHFLSVVAHIHTQLKFLKILMAQSYQSYGGPELP